GRKTRLWLHLVGGRGLACCSGQRDALLARVVVQHLQRRVAEAELWHIENTFEGKVIRRLRDDAQIGEGVTNFRALVKARAADHAIGHPELNKAVLKFTHLE